MTDKERGNAGQINGWRGTATHGCKPPGENGGPDRSGAPDRSRVGAVISQGTGETRREAWSTSQGLGVTPRCDRTPPPTLTHGGLWDIMPLSPADATWPGFRAAYRARRGLTCRLRSASCPGGLVLNPPGIP